VTTSGLHDVTIGGRGFLIDWKSNAFRGPSSAPLLRNQADTSGRPGEGALNPEDFWRRIISSWHHGSGQSVYDADDSDPFRYHESTGVDPWTKNQLSLLGTMDMVFAATSPQVIVAGAYLILLDADTIYRSDASTLPAIAGDFTSYTGGSQAWTSITTDHTYIYATNGADVYQWPMTDAGYGSAWNTLDCTKLAYVRGRLMAAQDNILYNITSSTPPSALFTHSVAGFVWTAFAESRGHIYAAGYHANATEVFKIAIKDDGTALDAPVQAAILPTGEQVLSMAGYAGFLLLGTSLGVRLAQADADGFLAIGALIPMGAMYSAFGYGKFVWCGGAGNPPSLVRLDLETFTEPLVPAYANDLVAGAEVVAAVGVPRISTVVRYQDRIVAAVTNPTSSDGCALYIENPDVLVAGGTLTSGKIRYGIIDSKVAVYLDATMTTPVDDEAVIFSLSIDGGAPSTIGGLAGGTSISLSISTGVNRSVEITAALGADVVSPYLTGLALRSYPAPSRVQVWEIPVLLGTYALREGATEGRNPETDLAFLAALAAPPDPSTTMTFGTTTYSAFVEDYTFIPSNMTSAFGWNGTCLVKLKTHAVVVEE